MTVNFTLRGNTHPYSVHALDPESVALDWRAVTHRVMRSINMTIKIDEHSNEATGGYER